MSEEKATMTVREMADYLGMGMTRAYELIRTPGFPVLRLSRKKIIIPKKALDEWVKKQIGRDCQ